MEYVKVRAVRDTKMGISDVTVPKGHTGRGYKYKVGRKTYWVVEWNRSRPNYGIGQHPLRDIEPI